MRKLPTPGKLLTLPFQADRLLKQPVTPSSFGYMAADGKTGTKEADIDLTGCVP